MSTNRKSLIVNWKLEIKSTMNKILEEASRKIKKPKLEPQDPAKRNKKNQKEKDKLPNFLVIGAQKSATTSLYHYLNEHREVYAITGARYFASLPNFNGPGSDFYQKSTVRTLHTYKKLFANLSPSKKAIGEVACEYLFFYNQSVPNIKQMLGDSVKIIVLLRNPIEACYSRYLHNRRMGYETSNSLRRALEIENQRIAKGYVWDLYYSRIFKYHNQVKAYLDNFKHVKVFLYEELRDNPEQFIKGVFSFIKVGPHFVPDLKTKYNISREYKWWYKSLIKNNPFSKLIAPLLPKGLRHTIVRQGQKEKKEMALEDKCRLREVFKEDIHKLEALINKDLSHWLK